MGYLDRYNHSNGGQRSAIEKESRHVIWENTNMMLGQYGYVGCKTGITDAAGPCLSAVYHKDGYNFVIILLNAKSMEVRWQEVPQLVEFAKAKCATVPSIGLQ